MFDSWIIQVIYQLLFIYGFLLYNYWFSFSINLNIRLNTLSNLIVLTVLLVSSCVILNAIDYLSIISSYLFLCYILVFQFTMFIFTITHDLILSFLY